MHVNKTSKLRCRDYFGQETQNTTFGAASRDTPCAYETVHTVHGPGGERVAKTGKKLSFAYD